MNNTYELYHHGVKGMKWGVRKEKRAARREKELQYRDKLKKSYETARKAGDNSNAKRLKYRSRNIVSRTAQVAASIAANDIVTSLLIGGSPKNLKMVSGRDWVRQGLIFAGKTAATVAYNDALANSTAKRYDQSGRHIKKEGLFNKEDMIEKAVKTAATGAMIGGLIYKAKVSQTRAQQAKGRQWAGHVLESRAGKTITLDPSQYRVLDN